MDQTFDWNEEVTSKWDLNATNWDERSKSMWINGSRKAVIPFMQKHVAKQSHILDVGCSSGYGSFLLYQAGYDVTGVDISNKMIRLAKQHEHATDIKFVQADVNQLPFQDDEYDALMAINVLEWTKVPSNALVELSRVLKRHGLLCVGILGPTAGPRANSYRRVYGEGVTLNTMMPWEFLQLAEEQGFELLSQQPVWKRETDVQKVESLPLTMQQALSFMWLFMLQKK